MHHWVHHSLKNHSTNISNSHINISVYNVFSDAVIQSYNSYITQEVNMGMVFNNQRKLGGCGYYLTQTK